MILLASVLLVAGLCGCGKADPVDPGCLPGTWCKVYPEGVVTEGSVSWTFGEDNKLVVRVYDVFSGDYRKEFVYRVGPDGRTLTIGALYGWDSDCSDWAEYRMERCDATTLVLRRAGEYAKDATTLEGKVTWFEWDVTFRRWDGK